MTHQTSNTDLREQIAEGLLTARRGGDIPTLTDYIMQLIEADKAAVVQAARIDEVDAANRRAPRDENHQATDPITDYLAYRLAQLQAKGGQE